MKKNKFLSGLSAKLALAIVALTTTMFTSCEKENIGIEVTPVNAKFIITPVVIDATTGTDVTQSAEISFSKGNGTYEGTPELASESININAKYKGMTGSASVTIPALKAGQFGAKEVTIILSENFFAQEESSNSQIETTKHSGFKDNTSDYWYYITVTYTKKEGSEVIKNDYEGDDSEIKNIIDAYNKGVREDKVTLDGNPVASFTVDSYNTIVSPKNEQIPGHGHAPSHGHGHGHGDDSNAGGGIIIAD